MTEIEKAKAALKESGELFNDVHADTLTNEVTNDEVIVAGMFHLSNQLDLLIALIEDKPQISFETAEHIDLKGGCSG